MAKLIRLSSMALITTIGLGVAGCATAPTTLAPPPTARPAPVPPPAPAPTPRPTGSWLDWAVTDGDWSYSQDGNASIARFGDGRAPQFAIRCDRNASTITLAHPGFIESNRSATMTIRTTSGTSALTLANSPSQPGYVAAQLRPRDPQLDSIIFSRGRFVIDVQGAAQPLVLPTWPEIARVVEDCR